MPARALLPFDPEGPAMQRLQRELDEVGTPFGDGPWALEPPAHMPPPLSPTPDLVGRLMMEVIDRHARECLISAAEEKWARERVQVEVDRLNAALRERLGR